MAGRAFTIVVCFDGPERHRFLMVRNRERGWELPGGRVEVNETPEACALREFQEETGHRLDTPRLLLEQRRPHGTAWIFTGFWGPAVARGPPEDEVIEETRFVHRLQEVQPLAFPDDPYEAMEQVLGRPLR